MSWPRQSLFIALVALSAQWAAADTLTVNTTADSVSNDGKCSLREAVEYFNLGKPEGGYMGCEAGESDDLDFISLPANASPYLISAGPIRIHKELSILGAGRSGDDKTTVAVQGAHRAFVIYDEPVYRTPACSVTTSCEPAGANSPYDDAPHLDDATDTGTSSTDNLTESHIPRFTGTVQVRPSTTQTDTTFPDPATRVETTTTHDYFTRVILYGTRLGGEKQELIAGYAEGTGAWTLQSPALTDGQVSFVYKTREDEIVTTTTVTYDLPADTVRSTSTLIQSNAGTTVSADSAAATVTIYTQPSRRTVIIGAIELVGCGLDAGCADDADGTYTYSQDAATGLVYDYFISGTAGRGGLVYSKEKLLLDSVIVKSGVATTGGAIYLATGAGGDITDSEFRGNKALDGVAVYAEVNSLRTERSLFHENVATGASGAVLHVASADIPVGGSQSSSEFLNTTVTGNDAVAMNLRNSMEINASTIVLNAKGGVDFNGENVAVYNTILAGNHTLYATAPETPVGPFSDCIDFAASATLPALPSIMENSLVLTGAGCPESANGIQAIDNVAGTVGQLMATDESGGICNSTYGVLCPLADNGGANFSHKPNLLGLYSSIADSPLVNKGSLTVGAGIGSCPGSDQRNQAREALSCDIGAIELQFVPTGVGIRSGGSIFYGQTYEQSLGDDLADEELLEAVYCPVSPPGDPAKVVAGTYRPDLPGCPWVEKLAQKGNISFGAVGTDGRYYYKPRSDFHGFDRFLVRIMTSTSRLNDDPADQSRQLDIQVVVEPPSGIASSSVGGAFDEIGLLVLALLGAGRLSRRRARA